MDMLQASNWEELVKLFTTHMGSYEDKLQRAATGTVNPDLSSLYNEFTEFKSFVWQALAKIKTQMEFLNLGFDRHETAMRRKVLLMHGLPEKNNEKLLETVHNVISRQLKLPEISIENLHVCHRLGSPRQRVRPVLVRFHDVEVRQTVWEGKTALKGSGVTISEFLTATRHKVFTESRKHFGIKNSWTVDGKIVVLLPDKSRRKIETMTELQSLTSKYPSANNDGDTNSGPSVSTDRPATITKKSRRR